MPVNTNASTYDNSFEQGPINPWTIFDNAQGPGLDITYGTTDYGQDITDKSYISRDYDWYNAFDVNEHRAQNQPVSHKIARGIGRVGVEVAANILQMPGYIGGAIAGGINALAGGEGSMDMFVNNAWVDSLEAVKDYYNDELAPVHIKNAVRDGNLWDNISSADFWATEGASGLAFLVSAFAPGAAITKFGTGLKMANALGKSNLFGKGSGLRLLMQADKAAAKVGLQSAENAINVVGATVANTLYEAGVEADGALEELRDSLEKKLATGEIDEAQYQELLVGAPMQAAKVFRDNLGILLVPNLIMSKALFGKAVSKKTLDAFETAGNKITPTLAKKTLGQKAGNIGKTVGSAFLSEAAIEEGGQATSTTYHTDNYIDDYLSGTDGKSFAETYMDMLGSTEGQKAMFLGTLFGSGAYAFGNHRSNKATNEQRAKLAELMTTGVNFFESAIDGIYKKDENGKLIINDKGEAEIDNEKVTQLGENLDFIKKVNLEKELYKQLAKQGVPGAQEKVDILDRTITNNMLYTFTHAGEEGIAVLKNYLENSAAVDNLIAQTNETAQKKTTKGEFVNNLVQEAETLRQDIEFFGKYGNFKNKLIENKDDVPYYEKYSKMIINKYAAVKSNLRFLDKAIAETKEAINKTKSELGVTEEAKKAEHIEILQANFTVAELKDKAKEKGLEGISKMRKAQLAEAIAETEDYLEEENDLISSLEEKLKNVFDLKIDNERELKGLSNERKQKDTYNKFKKNEIKRAKAEEEAVELDEVLGKIRGTTNATEMNNITIPEKFQKGNGLRAIEKVKQEQEEKFKALKEEANKKDSEDNKEDLNQEEEIKSKQIEAAEFIAKNFEKGEQVPTEGLDIPEGFDIFEEADENTITLSNENGETTTISIDTLYESTKDTLEEEEDRVEPSGGLDTYEPTQEESNPNMIRVNDDARLAITDNKKKGPVKPLSPGLNTAYKYELSPQDKRGDKQVVINDWREDNDRYAELAELKRNASEYTEEGYKKAEKAINDKYDAKPRPTTGNVKFDNALDKFYSFGVTEDNFDELLDWLPLGVKLGEDIVGPIETITKGDTKVYMDTSRKLRRAILTELLHGTELKDITVTIKGQYPGQIQIEVDKEGLPVENNIKDLYYFRGDLNNITEEDFYYTNENGILLDSKGRAPLVSRQDFPAGEIYLRVYTADGRPFPLKLNTKKVSTKEAEFLHSLFVTRSNEFVNGRLPENSLGKQQRLSRSQLGKFKREFPTEYKIITDQLNDPSDMTIKHVTDFFIFDNTSNIKSRIKFLRGNLHIGTKSFSNEQLKTDKQGFIDALTSTKRRQISIKPHKDNKSYNVNLTNKAYRDYLIDNKILNTNAKLESVVFKDEGINDPIFKDRTTMYLDIRSVKVKGEKSSHNAEDTATFRKNLFGSSKGLEAKFPKLYEKGLQLDEAAGVYLTAKDRKAVDTYINGPSKPTAEQIQAFKEKIGKKRVSSLKKFIGVKGDEKFTSAAIRGDVVDNLIREFFSPLQEINNNERFAKRGMELLEQYSKKHGSNILMNEEWFKEKLWPVVKRYAELFDAAGYTVYSNEIPVMFTMSGEQYAGTGDLLVHDNNTGEWGLIDIKTSTKNREELYDNKAYSYKEGDLVQQNAYREAYKQTAGIPIAWTKIMPLTTDNGAQGQYKNYLGSKATVTIGTKAKTREKLDDYLITVPNDKSIYDLKGAKEGTGTKIDVQGITAGVESVQESMEAMEEMPEEAMIPASILGDLSSVAKSLGATTEETPTKKEAPVTIKKQPVEKVDGSSIVQIDINEDSYFMTVPVFDKDLNPVSGGELYQIMPSGAFEQITDKATYLKLIGHYNTKVKAEATLLGKTDGVTIGPKSAEKFYNMSVKSPTTTVIKPTAAVQPKPGAPTASTKIAKVRNATEEVKAEEKEKQQKVKKVLDTKEELLSKITKENAGQVFKALKAKGLINPSNIKVIGSIMAKTKNDVDLVKNLITHLLDNEKKAFETVKNCIV